MLLENAQHNKESICEWINGKSLWNYNDTLKVWEKQTGDITFNLKDKKVYVIEDQHFDIRKAFALEQPIEKKHKNSEMWVDAIIPEWSKEYDYRLKYDWKSTLSPLKPLPCWVGDSKTQLDSKKHVALITAFTDTAVFVTVNSDKKWPFAMPLDDTDVFHKPQ